MDKKIESTTEEGLIIGLIDSVMTISSVLRKNLYDYFDSHRDEEERGEYGYGKPIEDALKDLRDYEPLYLLLQQLGFNKRILSEKDREIMEQVDKTIKLIKEQQIKINLD